MLEKLFYYLIRQIHNYQYSLVKHSNRTYGIIVTISYHQSGSSSFMSCSECFSSGSPESSNVCLIMVSHSYVYTNS